MKDIDAGFSKDLKTDTHMLKELKKDVQLQINELKMSEKIRNNIRERKPQKKNQIKSLDLKDTITHSSVLAWRIPGTGEPGGLLSMGSHRVGHD